MSGLVIDAWAMVVPKRVSAAYAELIDGVELDTPHGPAKAHVHPAAEARAVLVLGHGAAGGVTAPDLVKATSVASEVAVTVVLVEQPYRVAGRRSPAPAHHLDAAWTAVVEPVARG